MSRAPTYRKLQSLSNELYLYCIYVEKSHQSHRMKNFQGPQMDLIHLAPTFQLDIDEPMSGSLNEVAEEK